jgi:YggT family protein
MASTTAACGAGRWRLSLRLVGARERRRANRKATMHSLISLIYTVIQLYIYILIASAVLSWLIAFNVVNMRNQVVAMIAEALWRLTEPALGPIRRFLPNLGGLDISPVILILVLIFVQNLLIEYFSGF